MKLDREEAARVARKRRRYVDRLGPLSEASAAKLAESAPAPTLPPEPPRPPKLVWIEARAESIERARELYESSLVERPQPWASLDELYREALERGLKAIAGEVSPP